MLVAIRSEAALSRLDALCRSIFDDKRIQCIFTVPEPVSQFDRGMAESIKSRGGIVLPWEESLNRDFDLAIAASPNGPVESIRAPLMVMQHGPGLVKEAARIDTLRMIGRLQGRPHRTVLLEPTDPAEIDGDLGDVEAEAVGDPVYDSLAKSTWKRSDYRETLRVGNRKLVVLSSTWGPDSLLAHYPDLPMTLLRALPSNDYAVALILHPYAWAAHGKWQIETWFRRELEAGMRLIPHEQGWEATLLAGDCAIGDHGSVTCYANAIGLPTLVKMQKGRVANLKTPLVSDTVGSAEVFDSDRQAVAFCKRCLSQNVSLCNPISSSFKNVLHSLEAVREAAYRLMGLDEPRTPVLPPVVPDPVPFFTEPLLYRTRTRPVGSGGCGVSVESYPVSALCDEVGYDGFVVAVVKNRSETAPPFADSVVSTEMHEAPEGERELDDMLGGSRSASLALLRSPGGWLAKRRSDSVRFVETAATDPATISAAVRFALEFGCDDLKITVGERAFHARIY